MQKEADNGSHRTAIRAVPAQLTTYAIHTERKKKQCAHVTPSRWEQNKSKATSPEAT